MRITLLATLGIKIFLISACGIYDQCPPPAEYRSQANASIILAAQELVKNPTEKKAISYVLFGNSNKYTEGALENILMAKDAYPGWDVVIFADPTSVPAEILAEASAKGAIVHADPKYNHAAARFFVADLDYDRFICRDADSRIYPREVTAVADWMKFAWSHLHGMRDNKSHTNPLLAGMWGAQVKPMRMQLKAKHGTDNMQKLYNNFMQNQKAQYGDDELFLAKVVLDAIGYDHFISHETNLCNAFTHSRGFPIPRGISDHFIGFVVNPD